MTIIHRYLARHFLGPLAFALAVCSALFIIGDFFDLMRFLWQHPVPTALVGRYLLLRLPLVVYQVLPVAVLLAAYFCFGQLTRTNELTVLRAAGVSDLQLSFPLLALTLLLCLGAALFAIQPAGPLTVAARQLKANELRGKPTPPPPPAVRDFSLVLAGGASLSAGKVATGGDRLEQVTLLESYPDGLLHYRFDCARAEYVPGRGWQAEAATIREFRPDQFLADHRAYAAHPLPLTLEPATLWRLAVRTAATREQRLEEVSQQLTLPELGELIVLLDGNGLTSLTERVSFHSRLAYPFLAFGFAVLGLVFLSVFRQANYAFGFGLAILTAFLFLIFTAVSQALGMNQRLPAWVAGWLPLPAIFLLAFLLHRCRRT